MKIIKNNSLRIFIAMIVVSLILVISMGSSCVIFQKITIEDVAERLKNDWEIELPENSELIYTTKHLGFTGDGKRYYVVDFKEESVEFIENFNTERDEEFENHVKTWIEEIILVTETEIPVEYKPDLEKEYLWQYIEKEKPKDDLYLLFYPDSLRLYVLMFHV